MVRLSLLITTIFLDPCNTVSLIIITFKNNLLKFSVLFRVVSRERWCVCVCVWCGVCVWCVCVVCVVCVWCVCGVCMCGVCGVWCV
jgi:hypothetical protein